MVQTQIPYYVTDCTKDGKCSRCGSCCSTMLPMTEKEVQTIKKWLKKHHVKEQRHNGMIGTDMTCPFRDEMKKECLIYEVRPWICRDFMCNKKPEDIWKSKIDAAHMNCNIVFMRSEFFGNDEDLNLFNEMAREVIRNAKPRS